MTLTGPDGRTMPMGAVAGVVDTALSVTIAIDGALASGSYIVAWRTMATDGHPSHGTFVFTIAATTTAMANAGAGSQNEYVWILGTLAHIPWSTQAGVDTLLDAPSAR